MKLVVSWLRDFVDVDVPIKDLAWGLHLCGFEVASVEDRPRDANGREDAVIDFELTANRPDCLSVVGLARETSVRYGAPLRITTPAGLRDGTLDELTVVIEDPALCPRYAAAMADVRIGASPEWLRARLEAAGVRSINNIVDVTNYVLLECGQPMHAFDFARLGGATLCIRRARDGERVTTLDGQDRALTSQMLVIADAERPQAVGGVMGGADSEVTDVTKTIVLESAYFQPQSVRRTSKRLGLSTEASHRFERGADPDGPVTALSRACELIEQIGAGSVRAGWIDAHPSPSPRQALALRPARVAAILGQAVDAADVERILRGLGFDVRENAAIATVLAPHPSAGDRLIAIDGEAAAPAATGSANTNAAMALHPSSSVAGAEAADEPAWRVTAPSWRIDVAREIDLIEEIARHVGYDALPTTFPEMTAAPAHPDERLERERLVRRLAGGLGLSEATTFTFIERAAASRFADESALVAIANPLSEKFAVLRPSILPGLVESLAYNRRREQRDVRLYETGSVFTQQGGERRVAGLVWTGAAAPEHWTRSGRAVDFFDIKGVLGSLCVGMGLEPRWSPADARGFAAGRTAALLLVDADGRAHACGVVGQVDPAVSAAFGLPDADEIFAAEIDLDAIGLASPAGAIETRAAALPRFPSIVRDLSIVLAQTLPAAAVHGTIHAVAPTTLVSVMEFDRYQGKGIPDDRVSLSLRLTFRSPDRTLTDAEVDAAMAGIVDALARAHGAERR